MGKLHLKQRQMIMFKQRLLTTLILGPLVLLCVLWGNRWVFNGLLFAMVLGCSYEWLKLIPIKQRIIGILFILIVAALCIISPFLKPWLLFLGLFSWVFLTLAIVTYPKSQIIWGKKGILILLGFIVLPLFFYSMQAIWRQPHGPSLIIYLLLLVWSADIGAYLVGKRFGQTKLIPKVSPGKTYEGLLGGLLLTLGVATLGFLYFQFDTLWVGYGFAIGIFLISVIGDLSISLFKRRVHLKDTGALIPGHGGLLDRLDSLIAAAPVFYFILVWIEPLK